MEIKTLAQIVAENAQKSEGSQRHKKPSPSKSKANNQPWAQARKSTSARGFAVSDDNSHESHDAHDFATSTDPQPRYDSQSQTDSNKETKVKKRKKKKTFHPASPYQPKVKHSEPIKEVDPNSIKNLLAQIRHEAEDSEQQNKVVSDTSSDTESDMSPNIESTEDTAAPFDNLPSALKAYLKTPEQRQAEKEEIKANSRLRWLAFYYLSRREHSAGELRQKLLDKEQDPEKIEELLQEFAEKGYQSDHRTALMLIREGIRKGRGRVRIKNDFYNRKVEVPSNIDELIDMAMHDNEEFVDVLSDNDLVEGVDWLRLAVEARVKKYGDDIPTDQKIKARQLRFLQYRGFKPDICFQAIGHNLDTLDDRF